MNENEGSYWSWVGIGAGDPHEGEIGVGVGEEGEVGVEVQNDGWNNGESGETSHPP